MASKTKHAILAAYANLITQKNIDKVTVKDVVEICGITRQTFYYHFQDLLDVIEWGLRITADNAAKQGAEAQSMEEALYVFLNAADRNRQLGRKVLNSQKKTQICDIIFQAVQNWLFAMFKERAEHCSLSIHELDFALHFYAYAITGSMYDVILNDTADLNDTVKQITSLMQPVLSQVEF